MNNIIISGPDGVGKSTISKHLILEFKENGHEIFPIWLRFNHYLSKIVNFYGRLTGRSYYEKYSWGEIGYHDYKGVLGLLYIYSSYIDQLIFNNLLKRLYVRKDKTYVIDRFLIDTVVDLIVDTDKEKIILDLFCDLIMKEIKTSNIFILKCDKEIVYQRRTDILDDKNYEKKIEAFKKVALYFNIQVIDTGKLSINTIVNKISDLVK